MKQICLKTQFLLMSNLSSNHNTLSTLYLSFQLHKVAKKVGAILYVFMKNNVVRRGGNLWDFSINVPSVLTRVNKESSICHSTIYTGPLIGLSFPWRFIIIRFETLQRQIHQTSLFLNSGLIRLEQRLR